MVLALLVAIELGCAAQQVNDRPPLASRLWHHAYEICGTDAPWEACLTTLTDDPDARAEGSASSMRELYTAAKLLCREDDDWQTCFAHLDPKYKDSDRTE